MVRNMPTKEEFQQTITNIGALEDMTEVRTQLADLSQKLGIEFDGFEAITKERDSLKEKNTKLTKANMDLYLQVTTPANTVPNPAEPKPAGKKLTFDNLFDEKGDLK